MLLHINSCIVKSFKFLMAVVRAKIKSTFLCSNNAITTRLKTLQLWLIDWNMQQVARSEKVTWHSSPDSPRKQLAFSHQYCTSIFNQSQSWTKSNSSTHDSQLKAARVCVRIFDLYSKSKVVLNCTYNINFQKVVCSGLQIKRFQLHIMRKAVTSTFFNLKENTLKLHFVNFVKFVYHGYLM